MLASPLRLRTLSDRGWRIVTNTTRTPYAVWIATPIDADRDCYLNPDSYFWLWRRSSVALRQFRSSRSSQAPSTIQQPHAQSAAQGSIRRTTTMELNVAKMTIGFHGSSR